MVWPECYPDGIYTIGLGYKKPYSLAAVVWIYCVVFWFIQDWAKVQAYYWLGKYNVFNINNTMRKGTIDREEPNERDEGLKTKLLV